MGLGAWTTLLQYNIYNQVMHHTHKHTQCSVVTARNVRVGVGGEVIRLVGALLIIITLRLSLSATKSSASQKS